MELLDSYKDSIVIEDYRDSCSLQINQDGYTNEVYFKNIDDVIKIKDKLIQIINDWGDKNGN